MSESKKGVLLKGIGGFYYVDTPDGVYECRARGVFRKLNIKPLTGDRVIINSIDENSKSAFLFEILERDNKLIRPAVANVSQIVAVIAAENPKPNLYLLDKVIASAEIAGIDVIVCINKTDLADAKIYSDIYSRSGFKTVEISTVNKTGIDVLKKFLKGKTSVFAGNSGVGKSSLINLLLGENFFQTGDVSKKAERGKHTTRHTELRALPFDGYIIDTPGFGTIEIENSSDIMPEDMFREFKKYVNDCKFNDCIHLCENGCAVISAVNSGLIPKSRYENYKLIISAKNNEQN